MNFLIITGMSGAGKTSALRYLEDLGGFCVDNLPADIFFPLTERLSALEKPFAAFSVDVRGGAFFDPQAVSRLISEARQVGARVQTLFFDASDEVLVARYKESRREHPLSGDHVTLTGAIAAERLMLQPLRETADFLIDTTGMRPQALKKRLREIAEQLGDAPEDTVRVEVMSFGFKRGLPATADLVFDVRFLPNPFYIPALCRHCGLDEDVRDYVMGNSDTVAFMDRTMNLLLFLLPRYRQEGKSRLVIAVGCTGGAHRSVAIAEAVAAGLREKGWPVQTTHRDVDIEQAHWKE